MLTFHFSFWKTDALTTTYFGNCESNGATPSGWGSTFAFISANTIYGFSVAQDFICPGSGSQTINLMGMYAKTRGAPHANTRMAIYTYTSASADGGTIYDPALALVCQWDSATLVNSTEQWWDKNSFTGTAVLTGGHHYRIATCTGGSLINLAYTSAASLSKVIAADYTGGFPDPIGAGSTYSNNLLMRVSVTGDGTTAPVPTQETYYVDTDYAGGDSNGSPAKPYINLQTAIAAR